ncbi:hypothetical protein DRN43_00620 [Thermococci archaeon]|nr:MAG: hypothetical protein DRN43_00620 [Thermococci archaeon]
MEGKYEASWEPDTQPSAEDETSVVVNIRCREPSTPEDFFRLIERFSEDDFELEAFELSPNTSFDYISSVIEQAYDCLERRVAKLIVDRGFCGIYVLEENFEPNRIWLLKPDDEKEIYRDDELFQIISFLSRWEVSGRLSWKRRLEDWGLVVEVEVA